MIADATLECDETMPEMDYEYTRPILERDKHFLTFQENAGKPVFFNHFVDCRPCFANHKCVSHGANVHLVYGLIHILFSGQCDQKMLDIFQDDILPRAMYAGKDTFRWQNWLKEYGWKRAHLDFRGSITTVAALRGPITATTNAMRRHYKQQWLMLVFFFFSRLREYGILKRIHEFL